MSIPAARPNRVCFSRLTSACLSLGVGSILACLIAASAAPARADDWTQYRGPNRDGKSAETGIAKAWEAAPPKVLWKASIGGGYGTFAVAGKNAYVYVARNGNEVCLHLDADTGKEIWAARIDSTKTVSEPQGGKNPRSTPTIDGDRVYVFSTFMKLFCLNAADGKVVWSHDMVSEGIAASNLPPTIQSWGNAASPVLDGDLIFIAGGQPGKSLMAFDKTSGKIVWAVGNELLTHASPVPCSIHGVKQVIFFTQSGLVSLAQDSGQELWKYTFPFKVATAASPVVGGKDGDIVYCSAAYKVGAGAVRVDKQGDQFTATELWRTPGEHMSHWSTPVASGNYLFGLFGHRDAKENGPLGCIDLTTGKEMWSKDSFGAGGGTILIDNHVLVQSETGPITLIDASPDGLKEVGHVQPTSAKCWSAAIVANGRIFARGDNEAICLEVK